MAKQQLSITARYLIANGLKEKIENNTMTTQEAIDLYNKATGCKITEEALRYCGESTNKAVDMLQKTSEYARNMGGELRSRQLVALIIAHAELSCNS